METSILVSHKYWNSKLGSGKKLKIKFRKWIYYAHKLIKFKKNVFAGTCWKNFTNTCGSEIYDGRFEFPPPRCMFRPRQRSLVSRTAYVLTCLEI